MTVSTLKNIRTKISRKTIVSATVCFVLLIYFFASLLLLDKDLLVKSKLSSQLN